MQSAQWEIEVDRVTPREWSQILEHFDDASIYQTASYGAVRWKERNLSRLLLKRNGDVVGAAQIRIVRPTPFKFGIAYLRWGPLWERRGESVDCEVPIQMAKAIEEEYVKARGLSLTIIPNAFTDSPRAAAFQSAFSGFVNTAQGSTSPYRTILLDLAPTLEELRSRLDKKWRNQLTRSEKNGLSVVAGSGGAEFGAFCKIYSEMFKRKAFKTTVDIEEFARIQDILPEDQKMRVLLCFDKGAPVAGLVASAMGNSAIYLLGATSDAGLNAKGAYLLQWTLICWLKERGIRWYDLGGIDPQGNPGVYHFKKGFSGVDISQIGPLAASESVLSRGFAKAGLALKRRMQLVRRPFDTSEQCKETTTVS